MWFNMDFVDLDDHDDWLWLMMMMMCNNFSWDIDPKHSENENCATGYCHNGDAQIYSGSLT